MIRRQAEATFRKEISHAEHVQSGNILLRFAIEEWIVRVEKVVLLIEVANYNSLGDDSWNWWTFRSYANSDTHVKVVQELTTDIPDKLEIYRFVLQHLFC